MATKFPRFELILDNIRPQVRVNGVPINVSEVLFHQKGLDLPRVTMTFAVEKSYIGSDELIMANIMENHLKKSCTEGDA